MSKDFKVKNGLQVTTHITASGNMSGSMDSKISAGTGSFTNLVVGDSTTEGVSSSLVPLASLGFSLGSPTQAWNNLYINTIGLNSPITQLFVGNSKLEQSRIQTIDNGTFSLNPINGNVSIGTTIAPEKLTVEGNISASGTITMLTASIGGGIFTSASLAAGGGGSFNNFTLTADGGSNQTIEDGNTLDIAGGTNITTAVGATDTVTINLDASPSVTNITASGNISGSSTSTIKVGGIITTEGITTPTHGAALAGIADGLGGFTTLGVGAVPNLTTQIGKNTTSPLVIKGNLTASGDISASGEIFTTTVHVDSQYRFKNDNIRLEEDTVGDNLNISGGGLKANGNITASGDISSSGTIKAATLDADAVTDGLAAVIVAEIDNDEIPIAKLAQDAVTITAGDGLQDGGSVTLGSSVTLNIDASDFAGDGLGTNGEDLKVNVDDSSIEINSDTLRVKASGISNDMLAGSIANSKLVNDGITIAGADTSLGGSITADTIAGQISNDTISGNQINGGTIGSVTITDLTATKLNVTHFTSSFITSSTIVTEGSNTFGDTIADTHTFNGHITASGNISGSGNLSVNNIAIGGSIEHIGDANTSINLGDDDIRITAGGIVTQFTTTNVGLGGKHIFAAGNITSSGNISASGTLSGDDLKLRDDTQATNTPSVQLRNDTNHPGAQQSILFSSGSPTTSAGNDTARLNFIPQATVGSLSLDNFIANGTILLRTNNVTRLEASATGIDLTGNITASGNISASGNLSATGDLDIDGDADIDGTLEADAITVAGTALNTVIAGVTVTNATNAVNSTHVSVADNENTDEENLIPFIEDASATGNVGLESDGDFAYNPSTGTVTATIFKGNIDAVDGDFDGTLEADAITVAGTALADVIAGTTVTNATNAAVATTVTITDNESTNEENAIIFTAGGDIDGGNIGLESDGDLRYNPSTGTLTATILSASGAIQSNELTASSFQFVGSGNAELEVQGHITASGNISASGTAHTFGGTTTLDTTLTTTNKFEKTGNTDAEGQGDVVFLGGTTSMDAGKIYHYKSDGTWELADADDIRPRPWCGW